MEITAADPRSPEVAPLLARHLEMMRAVSPPESVHALDGAALAGDEIHFFALREEGRILGMGALKRLSADHAEIKSMHILAEARGRGLARRMVDFLIAEARRRGMVRLSLETGTEPDFAPARRLYVQAGFRSCPPFADYVEDPNSCFMTRVLAPDGTADR